MKAVLSLALMFALFVFIVFGAPDPGLTPDLFSAVIATGVAKQLRYKAESTWGVAAGASGAQLLRRVGSNFSLKKETYESEELTSNYQRGDFRHGVRSVGGTINGELSPGTWEDFIAAAVRRAFTAVSALTGLSLTMAGSGPTYTITRGSGDFLAGGVKVGQVWRITAGSVNAANLNKNFFILNATATVLTVMPLNGVALVAEGPIASCTLTLPGKTSYVPTTGHTDVSFSIEHWYSDVAQSELFLGCKIQQLDINLPATGLATIAAQMMGKDVTTATSAYFSSPTAETTFGVTAAVNGLLIAQNGALASITGMNVSIKGNMTAEPVVGSNTYPDILEGRVLVDGQFTALFENATIRDYFLNETEVSLALALSTGNTAAADFLTISLPRIKVGGADKDDGDKALIQTLPFTALYNSAGGAGVNSEQSTIAFHDSQA